MKKSTRTKLLVIPMGILLITTGIIYIMGFPIILLSKNQDDFFDVK